MCSSEKKDWKWFLSHLLVKPFKEFPCFGRQRFWFLYWAYKITQWHIRHKEWDFVLEYLPRLEKWQNVSVLDVGCCRNLFCHEVISRGYKLTGIDLQRTGFEYPGVFYIKDITQGGIYKDFNFVTCISVLEHIQYRKREALENMIFSLRVHGRLLITIPTKEYAQGHPWPGFTLTEFNSLLPDNSHIIDYEERLGQMCVVIERTA